jgi:hypothetical protein
LLWARRLGAIFCASAIVAHSQNAATESAAPAASVPRGTVERVKVHGASLVLPFFSKKLRFQAK